MAVTDVSYDQATKLSQCRLPGLSQVAAMTSHTMSLQCYYFTLWANYGALCISQLLTPSIVEDLQGSLFPNDFPVLQHCFQHMIDMWDKLTRYLHLTTESRVQLANNMFGSICHVSTIIMLHVPAPTGAKYNYFASGKFSLKFLVNLTNLGLQ